MNLDKAKVERIKGRLTDKLRSTYGYAITCKDNRPYTSAMLKDIETHLMDLGFLDDAVELIMYTMDGEDKQ